ncbi:MAG: DUF815 domain-containing protein [Clostridiales bacterium]|nr:DUF815 domain-containing protein [Clostridiales bacterium]
MKRRLDGLVVFRELLRNEAVAMFREVLQDRCRNDGDAFTAHCGEFVFRLFQQGDCWTEYLRSAVMESENVCIRNWASGTVTALQERCLDRELAFLDQLSQVTLADLTAGLDNAPAFLEGWRTEPGSIAQDYRQRMQEVGAKGYGIFARYHMFTVENGQLVPVKHPDPQQLEQLPGYEQERQKVIANNFAPQGLRLVEVKKNQLYQIPDLMDALAANPLKFILFIDDLSFTSNDDNFAALKAILEGSVGGRAQNIAVYATSNRRHLIKETMTDRTGDDIHESDTRQELMSLSARFGLTVTFASPDRDRYLYIVRELAKQYGVDLDEHLLAVRSEAFAIRMGGRSARVAKQFIELCKSGVQV